MMSRQEIMDWLTTLPADSGVYVDDGGLCLRCDMDPEAYLEIGGQPEEEAGDGG